MDDKSYPILVFPKHAAAERTKRSGGFARHKIPNAHQQGERLVPQFQRLQNALAKRRLKLQDSSLGIEPEQALVLETVGSVDDFIRAVNKVKGLEWLAEYEIHDIPPEGGFENAGSPDEPLSGRLFLMMTDQRALGELRNLFDAWRRNPEAQFKSGLAPFKKVFKHLVAIRVWDVEDRLRDTGLLSDWEERVSQGQETVLFEAELWYRHGGNKRQEAGERLRRLVQMMNGEIVGECQIPSIAYHAALGRIQVASAANLLMDPDAQREIELFSCDDVMFLRPSGQCAAPLEDASDEDIAETRMGPVPQAAGSPVVALLDGMPLTGHHLLNGRVVVDDPDEYESQYQARERSHGTAMASLICHDDINAEKPPLNRPIYVRPIMQPRRGFNEQFNEAIPENVLPVDLVHRSVIRMLDGEARNPPASPEVRVINLSIGDPARPFVREMSAWARLLDWLSWKYNVLFVVSAGNHSQNISLYQSGISKAKDLSKSEFQRLTLSAIAEDTRNRCLLSPAETMNGITIGAAHADESGPAPTHLVDPLDFGMPSILCAHGPGFRRSIKPELFLAGGKQLMEEDVNSQEEGEAFRLHRSWSKPGQLVATPGQEGRIDAVRHSRGTSNAAALGARAAFLLYELIESLRSESGKHIPAEFDSVLMKALLVHGCQWNSLSDAYREVLEASENKRAFRESVARFFGYRASDLEKAMRCAHERATVIGFGALVDGEAAEFSFPLPPSISESPVKRRVIVTLAWFSPINSSRQRYRVAHLWFEVRDNVASQRICAGQNAVQRGTVQHEVFESGSSLIVGDSSEMIIKVNCRSDADDILEPVRFGLAVNLEVAESNLFPVPIYEEVRERIAVGIKVAAEAG